ncbi:type VI secretion system Vgr family protein [Cupriavidus sp. YAF13]|uniref:type VI secretion system Vgr family protein n=1 Tax=Cupriavidus sp. YAF13 TaxID=3233075 RepID=UPI003F8FFFE1
MRTRNDVENLIARRRRTVSVSSAAIPDLLGQPQLEFVRLSGHEGLSELFTYKVDLRPVSPAAEQFLAEADPDDMIGREMTVTIELDGMGTGLLGGIGAGHREITGVISEIEQVGGAAENRLYRFTLRPWLWLATQTSDFKPFQKKTVIEILDEVLADYPFSVEKRLDVSIYPKLVWEVQLGETDAHFIQRLTEEYGITYFFEHDGGHHRLILAAETGAYRNFPSEAYHTLPIYPHGFKVDQEHLVRFDPVNRLRTGKVTLNDYDFRKPRADLTTDNSQPRETGFADFERYEYPGDYVEPAVGDMRARIRMEERRTRGRRVRGVGALRGVAPGCTYMVSNHGNPALNREFLVTSTTFDLEDVGGESGSRQRFACRVAFEGHPTDEVFRPPRTVGKPRVAGLQRAVVTGPKNQEIWCNEHGSVNIQFEWDRYGQHDENSSPWIRVVNGWSGDQFGAMHIPRIGQEVIVAFLNGDPDCPLIVGRVPNQFNMSPWALPGQHALSGIRSKELFGERHNHLLMDDTKDQIQSQLSSDHRLSQLNLGYLTSVPDHAGRKDRRGEGAELRTDGHMALRSGAGTLVSSELRTHGQGAALDLSEAMDRLRGALSLAEQLQQASVQAQAQHDEQDGVAKAIARQNDAIKGDESPSGMLAEPHIVVASAAGIVATATTDTHLHSTRHATITTGEHLSLNTGKGFFASVRGMFSLCAHLLGVRLFAAKGPITLQAQNDVMQFFAKLGIDIISTDDNIRILAKKELLIGGGSSHTRYNDGGITHLTRGTNTAHAAGHSFTGPSTETVAWPKLAKSSVCEFGMRDAASSGQAVVAVS